MEYEEDDDDILFTKWMSSFWGHSGVEDVERDGRNPRRRLSHALSERRTSLPCPAQLCVMRATRFHSLSKAPSPVYLKGCKEIREDPDRNHNSHLKISKVSSLEGPLSNGQKKQSNSIQEFSESFEKQLRFRSKRSTSLGEHSVTRRNSSCREKVGEGAAGQTQVSLRSRKETAFLLFKDTKK